MPRKTPKEVITDLIPVDMVRWRKRYPEPLPGYLAPWYLYLDDHGHSVLVALASAYTAGGDPGHFMVPVPVRTVLRLGWTTCPDGYPVVALDYTPADGPDVPAADYQT